MPASTSLLRAGAPGACREAAEFPTRSAPAARAGCRLSGPVAVQAASEQGSAAASAAWEVGASRAAVELPGRAPPMRAANTGFTATSAIRRPASSARRISIAPERLRRRTATSSSTAASHALPACRANALAGSVFRAFAPRPVPAVHRSVVPRARPCAKMVGRGRLRPRYAAPATTTSRAPRGRSACSAHARASGASTTCDAWLLGCRTAIRRYTGACSAPGARTASRPPLRSATSRREPAGRRERGDAGREATLRRGASGQYGRWRRSIAGERRDPRCSPS